MYKTENTEFVRKTALSTRHSAFRLETSWDKETRKRRRNSADLFFFFGPPTTLNSCFLKPGVTPRFPRGYPEFSTGLPRIFHGVSPDFPDVAPAVVVLSAITVKHGDACCLANLPGMASSSLSMTPLLPQRG